MSATLSMAYIAVDSRTIDMLSVRVLIPLKVMRLMAIRRLRLISHGNQAGWVGSYDKTAFKFDFFGNVKNNAISDQSHNAYNGSRII